MKCFVTPLVLLFTLSTAHAFGPPKSDPPAPNPTPEPRVGITIERITGIASSSSCAKYSWKNRSKAPAGYIKGIALTYGRSLCRLQGLRSLSSAAKVMGGANTGNAAKDSVTHYAPEIAALGLRTGSTGAETLRAIYTLGVGLGMRESSGKYCEGYDTSADSQSASEAEAGLFQASYNSMAASSELRKVYDEYRADPSRCYLNTFKEGVSCRTQSIIGTGAGADYQRFAKSCPAFATEYTMVLLRVLRKHFGPINRKEAEVRSECARMLLDVERFVQEDPRSSCSELK